MGNIAVACPGIDRFHLHERLLRSLRERGHRCTVLCPDAAAALFWRCQGGVDVAALPELHGTATPAAPLDELARRDAGGAARTRARLAALLPRLWAWFTNARPDLVLLHQRRCADSALVQFVARAAGCRVLWTGDGLLPNTLQLDDQGIDGDASCCRRSAGDYRVVQNDPELLRACLADALARTSPAAPAPRAAVVPPLRARLACVPAVWRQRGFAAAAASPWAWRAARSTERSADGAWTLPATPFVALLLQDPADTRVRLDGGGAPSANELVAAAEAAVAALDPTLLLVVVAPSDSRVAARQRRRWIAVPAAAAADAAATALATITVNHPLASVALLAGTPVVHTGAALYGVRGVATKATRDSLEPALREALARDHPTLRERVLSWLFGYGHVWCSPGRPDHNGVQGLVRAIEARLLAPASGLPVLRYRAGPAWPLAVERPRR